MIAKTGTYRTVVSPYRKAFYLGAYRLQYDLDVRTWQSRRATKLLHNKYQGKCIILCNGPSLNAVDFEMLKQSKAFTIGLNKINLLFDRTDFRPDIICAVNPFVVRQNLDFFLNTNIPLFVDYRALSGTGKLPEMAKKKGKYILHSTHLQGEFSTDLSKSVCQGYTVTYVALQVAFYLGFSEVALVGCDHNFVSKGPPNSTITQDATENNHFIQNYFPPGSQWHLPDLPGSQFHYAIAAEVFRAAGRSVVNCTDGGSLEVFDRRPLADFLKEPAAVPADYSNAV